MLTSSFDPGAGPFFDVDVLDNFGKEVLAMFILFGGDFGSGTYEEGMFCDGGQKIV